MQPPACARPARLDARNLFPAGCNAILTIAVAAGCCVGAAAAAATGLFFNACRRGRQRGLTASAAAAGGACWGFVAEKYRLILFGRYPYEEQWRPLLASLLIVALLGRSC